MSPGAAIGAPGDVIENTATYTVDGGPTLATNTATLTVRTRPSQSVVEFLRIGRNGACVDTEVGPSRTVTAGSNSAQAQAQDSRGASEPVPPRTVGGVPVNIDAPVCLTPADEYTVGELIFVSVEDAGQNANPAVRDRATIIVTSANGDTITVMITETGPDTGRFVGFVPSRGGNVDTADGALTLADGVELTATYQDAFDTEEVSVDIASAQRSARVFDSVTGEPVDGAVVTLIDASTGAPAIVPGPLGTNDWPSQVTSGADIVGPDGIIPGVPGGFAFPFLDDGTYTLLIEPPEGFRAPSAITQADVAPGFRLGAGSFLASFTVMGGAIAFDVPLDPVTRLIVAKQTNVVTVRAGGLVSYDVTIRNAGGAPAILSVQDTLPAGFRFEAGTMRLDGEPVTADASGRSLDVAAGTLAAGDTARLSYTARVLGEADPGPAINRIFVADGSGAPISNTAEARVEVEEDRLLVRTQILGRVAADRCVPEDDWPRRISDGIGVPGVRLLMETGAYVVTDRDGLYSFADVSPRAHVVRLDETSLPDGYEVVACEENTRSAGDVRSRIVDAQGGMIWRADFSVRRTDGAATASDAFEANIDPFDIAVGHAPRDYDEFGTAWLDAQSHDIDFAYPAEGFVPDTASLDFGLVHPRGAEVDYFVNGKPVDFAHMAERKHSSDRKMSLSNFRGVSLRDGENRLSAVVRDAESKLELGRATRGVWFVREAARAEVLPEASSLIADGRSVPTIAIRLSDAGGRPVHTGRLVDVAVEPPHALLERIVAEEIMPIGTPQLSGGQASVGADGVLLVRLAPTTVSGLVEIAVPTVSGERRVTALLSPTEREWIVVGLADGILGDPTNAVGVQDMENPRLAAYAQGTVGDGWLVTAAIDTAKDDDEEAGELFRQVDPNDRYALYGDRSEQNFDAQSRFPVYLRAEKGGTKAVVGDFDTGLSETTLGRYDRRLTGGYATHRGDNMALTAFVAETDQVFRRDEIAADGTSGPYRVTGQDIVVHSEIVAVETRDLFRPDVVTGVRTLTRFVDYDLDYATGELLFTAPVNANQSLYDTNVIVVSYEAESGQGGEATAGGRATRTFGKARVGATLVHEGGLGGDSRDGTLASVDALVQLTDTTQLRAEFAVTNVAGADDATAILIEAEHASDRVVGKAWYTETEAGFGLGQQSTARLGARRYGAAAELSLGGANSHNELDGDDAIAVSGDTARYALRGQVSRQEELGGTGAVSVGEASIVQETGKLRLSAGLRATEEVRGDDERRSVMLTSALRRAYPEWDAAVTLSIDQPLGLNEGDAATLFPRRVSGQLEKRIGFANLTVGHERLDVNEERSANTTLAVTATPWAGATLKAGTDLLTADGGRRVGATFGADQQVPLTKHITASANLTRRVALGGDETLVPVGQVARDLPVSPLEGTAEFLSAAFGLAYRAEGAVASGRVEFRDSELGIRTTQVLGAAREVSERFSLAATARLSQTDVDGGADRRSNTVTFGAAWRPRGEGAIVLHRLDLDTTFIEDGISTEAIAATTAIAIEPTARLDVSAMHAVRYEGFDQSFTPGVDVSADALSQVAGIEARYDLDERFDIGLRGSVRYDHDGDTLSYSYGPSLGVSPAEGVWMSVGYNVSGFEAEGFDEAEHTDRGLYLAARVTFDEGTAKGLLNRLGR